MAGISLSGGVAASPNLGKVATAGNGSFAPGARKPSGTWARPTNAPPPPRSRRLPRDASPGAAGWGGGAGEGDAGRVGWGGGGWSVEEVAKASTGPKMFQLYHHGDRAWAADLLARVEASGYQSVVLTVDVQVYGRRERDIFNRYSPREAMTKAPNPRGPDGSYPERLTWDDVAWLKKTTRLPLGIKGIMTTRDAKRAVESGVDIVWVSNHGGRQLDHAQGSIDALPPIVDAVAGAAAIVVDGGFTRGTAVLKGLALGATVVAVGRTILWGLAADGATGVACALDILRRDLRTTMGLSGQTSVKSLSPDLVFRVD